MCLKITRSHQMTTTEYFSQNFMYISVYVCVCVCVCVYVSTLL